MVKITNSECITLGSWRCVCMCDIGGSCFLNCDVLFGGKRDLLTDPNPRLSWDLDLSLSFVWERISCLCSLGVPLCTPFLLVRPPVAVPPWLSVLLTCLQLYLLAGGLGLSPLGCPVRCSAAEAVVGSRTGYVCHLVWAVLGLTATL